MCATLYTKARKTTKTDKPQLLSLTINTRQQYVRCVCVLLKSFFKYLILSLLCGEHSDKGGKNIKSVGKNAHTHIHGTFALTEFHNWGSKIK